MSNSHPDCINCGYDNVNHDPSKLYPNRCPQCRTAFTVEGHLKPIDDFDPRAADADDRDTEGEQETDETGLRIHLGEDLYDRSVTINGEEIPCSSVSIDCEAGEEVEATLTVSPDEVDVEGLPENATFEPTREVAVKLTDFEGAK